MQLAIQFKSLFLAVVTAFTSLAAQLSSAQVSSAQDVAPEKLVVVTWNVEWMYDDDLSDNRSDLSK